MRITDDLEICSSHCRFEVGVVRAKTTCALLRELGDKCPLVGAAVVYILITESGVAGSSDKFVRERTRVAIRRDVHWSMPAAPRISLLAEPALLCPENRCNVGPAPTGCPCRHPSVEVGRMAPLVDLRINVGTSAQHFSTWCEDAPAFDSSLWFAFERPIQVCLEELAETCGDRNESAGGASTCLDKQNSELTRSSHSLGQ